MVKRILRNRKHPYFFTFFFASIARFVSRRFLVLRERDALFLVLTAILFAI
jgi:hypothetical protein